MLPAFQLKACPAWARDHCACEAERHVHCRSQRGGAIFEEIPDQPEKSRRRSLWKHVLNSLTLLVVTVSPRQS